MTSYTQINKHNMLIVTYMYSFGRFVDAILFYDQKESFYVKVITLASCIVLLYPHV